MDSYSSRGGHMAEGGLVSLVGGHTHDLTSKHIGPVDLLPYPVHSQPLSCSWVSSGTSWKYTCKSCLMFRCKYICIPKQTVVKHIKRQGQNCVIWKWRNIASLWYPFYLQHTRVISSFCHILYVIGTHFNPTDGPSQNLGEIDVTLVIVKVNGHHSHQSLDRWYRGGLNSGIQRNTDNFCFCCNHEVLGRSWKTICTC